MTEAYDCCCCCVWAAKTCVAVVPKLGLRLAIGAAAVELGSQLASTVSVLGLRQRHATAVVVIGLGPWFAAVELYQQDLRRCQLSQVIAEKTNFH